MEHGVDLSKPGLCRSLVSGFTACCCSTKPFLVDVGEHKEKHPGFLCSLLSHLTGCLSSKSNRKLTEELWKKYIIACSLSNYCAYLLVSKPELIPDSFLVPKMVFQETVSSARAILQGCDWPESRFNKLMKVAAEEEAENAVQDVKGGDDVVKQGAMLAKELLEHEKSAEGRWEILAGVWTELLIHIAPTWNAGAQRTCLESGGEFITNIWHCSGTATLRRAACGQIMTTPLTLKMTLLQHLHLRIMVLEVAMSSTLWRRHSKLLRMQATTTRTE